MIRYEDYQLMIFNRAHFWYGSTDLEMKECISIANLGFSEALTYFDPEKGYAFSTYLWLGIDIQFRKHFKANRSWAVVECRGNIEQAASTLNGSMREFHDKVMDLSGRAHGVVLDALRNPDEYFEQTTKNGYRYGGTMRLTKRVASLGYSWRTAGFIIDEIKGMLKEN